MPRWSICTVEAHPIREGKDTEVYGQRRRIKTEEKAKVVAVVWGEDIIQFLATLDILSRKIRARIHSFAHRSFCSNQMSDCERFAQTAQDK